MNSENKSNIAVIEFKSISKGIAVTDEMLKSAEVNLVLASTLCPGKYLTVLEGEVSAVENAVRTADRLGGRHVFSSEVISGINSEVIRAIGGKLASAPLGSMGIIEGLQMSNLISSADRSVDSADVVFLDFRLGKGCGAVSFFVITGILSSVEEAVENAISYLGSCGSLIAYKIINNPDRQVIRWLRSSFNRC
jgi:microcompartment protein CcmL/EutN